MILKTVKQPALLFLIDAAKKEEVKRSILAYFVLLVESCEPNHRGMTGEELRREMERWISVRMRLELQFMCFTHAAPGLGTLIMMNLVKPIKEIENGMTEVEGAEIRYSAVPLEEAQETLQKLWSERLGL